MLLFAIPLFARQFARPLGLAVLLWASAWTGNYPAAAQSIGGFTEPEVQFDIRPQDLAPALELYSLQSGRRLIYTSELSHGLQTKGVSGRHSTLEALLVLLEGTGLRPVMSGTGISLSRIKAEATPGQASGTATAVGEADGIPVMPLDQLDVSTTYLFGISPAHRMYAAAVGSQVDRALNRNKILRDGRYKAILSIWLAPSGEIVQSEVVKYSGDASLDKEIVSVLHGIRVSAKPPADLPQPIHLRIKSS